MENKKTFSAWRAIFSSPQPVDSDEPKRKSRKWLIAGAFLLAAVAVIGAVFLVYMPKVERGKYDAAVSQAQQAFAELDQAVAVAQEVRVDCVAHTGDEPVCEAFADALVDVPVLPEFTDAKDVGFTKLKDARAEAEEATSAANERTALLKERTIAVDEASVAYELQVAQEGLTTAIDNAQAVVESASQLLSDTEGQVADDQTRIDLQTVVDEATGVIGSASDVEGSEPAAYREKADELDKVVARLNENVAAVSASREAFEEARRQSAANSQRTAPAAKAPANSTRSGTTSGAAGSASKAAPQRSAPAPAPAPAAKPAPSPAPKPPATGERTILKAFAVVEGDSYGNSVCYHEIYWSDGTVEKRPCP